MKALDTNILVRLLTDDDPRQKDRVLAVFREAQRTGEPLFVSTPVVLELMWVLRSSRDFSREDVLEALERLLYLPMLAFESQSEVQGLIHGGRQSSKDLPDLLIALHAREAGCDATLTFDKKAARSPYFSLIE